MLEKFRIFIDYINPLSRFLANEPWVTLFILLILFYALSLLIRCRKKFERLEIDIETLDHLTKGKHPPLTSRLKIFLDSDRSKLFESRSSDDKTQKPLSKLEKQHNRDLNTFLKDEGHGITLDDRNYLAGDLYSEYGLDKEYWSFLASTTYLLAITFSFSSIAWALIIYQQSSSSTSIIEVVGAKFIVSVIGIISFMALQFEFAKSFSSAERRVASLRASIKDILLEMIKNDKVEKYSQLHFIDRLSNHVNDLVSAMGKVDHNTSHMIDSVKDLTSNFDSAKQQNHSLINRTNELDSSVDNLTNAIRSSEQSLVQSLSNAEQSQNRANSSLIELLSLIEQFKPLDKTEDEQQAEGSKAVAGKPVA